MDIIHVSVVNYLPIHGNNQENRERMAEFARIAKAQGSDLVLFPEMALTGYDYTEMKKEEMMPVRCAETIQGESVRCLAAAAKKLGIYLVFGMPEREGNLVYNSAAAIGPEGLICCHRKTHIGPPESRWAAKGNRATLFPSPRGPIGLAICYEVYRYPEFIRYARAKGARLFLNCTAASQGPEPAAAMRTSLEASAVINHMYIASADLCGKHLTTDFFGGSHIVGPSMDKRAVHYYAGVPFDHPDARTPGIYGAALDLSEAANNQFMYRVNPDYGKPDFDPALFAGMYQELAVSLQ